MPLWQPTQKVRCRRVEISQLAAPNRVRTESTPLGVQGQSISSRMSGRCPYDGFGWNADISRGDPYQAFAHPHRLRLRLQFNRNSSRDMKVARRLNN
jgi:hypothetical protein